MATRLDVQGIDVGSTAPASAAVVLRSGPTGVARTDRHEIWKRVFVRTSGESHRTAIVAQGHISATEIHAIPKRTDDATCNVIAPLIKVITDRSSTSSEAKHEDRQYARDFTN